MSASTQVVLACAPSRNFKTILKYYRTIPIGEGFSESMQGQHYSFTKLHDSHSDFQENVAVAVLLDERGALSMSTILVCRFACAANVLLDGCI